MPPRMARRKASTFPLGTLAPLPERANGTRTSGALLMTLVQFGWAEPFQSSFRALGDDTLVPARVSSAQRGQCTLWYEHGVVAAHVSGRLRHEATPGQLPVVGDWVAARLDARREHASIEALLPRRGALLRKKPGTRHEPQVLCANLDVVFLLSSLNH